MDVSIEYISAACNQVPHTVALNKNDTSLIYGACNSIIQVEIKNDRMVAKKAFIGHTDRVNCVRWTGNQSFVTGSTDKKVCLWENFNVIQVCKKLSSPSQGCSLTCQIIMQQILLFFGGKAPTQPDFHLLT